MFHSLQEPILTYTLTLHAVTPNCQKDDKTTLYHLKPFYASQEF